MDIMHDDTAPLYEDGSYRNWLCDLSLGIRSNNMLSFHKNKVNKSETLTNIKCKESLPETSILISKHIFPSNPLGELMRNAPQGIQFIQAKNRGNKYVLSRLFSITGKDMPTTGKKKITDEEKFIQVLTLYQKNCIKEKRDDVYMNVNIADYTKYIPN